MGVKVSNNAFGTLSAGINTSDTTITLDSGQGARFPSLGAGDYFYGTVVDTSNNLEIVKVTARSNDSMTVVRGQDGTTATAFSIGDRFELRPTAALFEEKFNVSGGTISGAITVDEDGATVATFDRATSDGTIVDLQKDGSTVGSIGTYLSTTYIGSGNANLMCNDVGAYLAPSASGGAVSDSVLDLGAFNRRFKDLYLSGGVYLGGVGSANKLDDYEEGTWTPALGSQFGQGAWDTDVITSIQVSNARYTKIGEMVTLICSFRFQGTSESLTTGANRTITGLPFTPLGPGDDTWANNDMGSGTFHVYTSLGSGVFSTGSIMSYQGNLTLTTTAVYGSVSNKAEVFFTYIYRTAS